MAFNIDPISDRFTACDILPAEIGYFSLDDHGDYHDNSRQAVRYYSPPRGLQANPNINVVNVNWDLNLDYETWIRERNENATRDGLLSWIQRHPGFTVNGIAAAAAAAPAPAPAADDDDSNIDDASQNNKPDLVCCQVLLETLLCTPYRRNPQCYGWKIAVCRYRGVLYGQLYDGDNRVTVENPEHDRMEDSRHLYRAYSFRRFITASETGSEPDLQSPVNSRCSFQSVMKTRIGRHVVVYTTSVNCLDSATGRRIELKLQRTPERAQHESNFRRYKTLSWWAECALNRADKVACGYTDKSGDDAIVTQLREFRASDLPLESLDVDNRRKIEVCYNFCDEFLQYVKETVQRDCDQEIYVFDFNPGTDNASVVCHIEGADSPLAFLPLWFTATHE